MYCFLFMFMFDTDLNSQHTECRLKQFLFLLQKTENILQTNQY